MRFEGTETYIATEDLQVAVNAAIVLERPLLIKGEPGTGKTILAQEIAQSLGMPLIEWHVKSTTTAQQGLYEYDAVRRLRDNPELNISDRTKVEVFIDNNFASSEQLATTSMLSIGDLLDGLDGADAHHDRRLGRAPAN